MKKVWLSLVAAFAVVSMASAQETGFGFGPKVGVNISSVSNINQSKALIGFTAGAFADYRFSDHFAVSADVLFSRQGVKGFNVDTKQNAKMKLSYLNIPILANWYIVKGLAVKAGIQPGFLLSAKYESTDIKSIMKSFDLAIPVGVSYLFDCGFLLDARYNIGVSKVSEAADSRNSVCSITAGWRF